MAKSSPSLSRVTATALLLGTLVLPAFGQQKPLDRAAIEAIIREYIVKNPEILQEAAVELERRQAEAQQVSVRKFTSDQKSPLYVSDHHAVVGNPKGDVTVVEFFDYNCGFCKRGLADVQRLLETDKNVRLILKDLPILSEGSREAAAVAFAVKKQLSPDAYWKFHLTLMAVRGNVGKETALGVAKDSGADMKKLEAELAKPGFDDAVEETKQIASALGISGTPSYVVAEDVVVGARGYDALASRIANFRKCKKAEC
ncbi:DsbG Protein-disulfide isomerase [Rhabdaerophilaceae bacterium]